MLNFIYYPVSAIMWFWHKAFGYVFGEASGIAWALAVVFLVFTLRAILYKPFVHQVRSMRKMQEFAPEMQKLKAKYGNDKQKLAAEMQKLQSQQGVNPLGGCLPVLVQVPVFIGLFHVLREFEPGKTENYIFDAARGRVVQRGQPVRRQARRLGDDGGGPAGGAGHLHHEHDDRHDPADDRGGRLHPHHGAALGGPADRRPRRPTRRPRSCNKLMLYVFPIGVVVGAPFLPLAVLIYWVSNNLWTLGQQYVVYKKIDAEEAEKKDAGRRRRGRRAPRGPVRSRRARRSGPRRPGGKPITRRTSPRTVVARPRRATASRWRTARWGEPR